MPWLYSADKVKSMIGEPKASTVVIRAARLTAG